MEKSLTMQFVQMRAQAEMKHMKADKISVEHLFLGLLKLSEMTPEELFHAPEFILRAAGKDMEGVGKLLKRANIDTTRCRGLLRSEAGRNPRLMNYETDSYMEKAEKIAEAHGGECQAEDLLVVILADPTQMIRMVCSLKGNDGHKKANNPKINGADGSQKDENEKTTAEKEAEAADLPGLTDRIRQMRTQLLSTVQGQDHVVHAFAEGMFAAEVLAASDEKRVRPRAIFVFAGPPGVGKTFLAEQAAGFLNMPFKRFDMSAYADHQAYMGLVGFERSYQGAKPGTLTEFVKQNPHSILLFDEIEKAHLNTIHLFLQILDAGRLADRYLDEDISFRDTIIIFTSNAGRSLYEGDARQNAAGVPRKTLINALETEKNPQTGQPYFPAAITSRLSTGWPLLFNHLQANNLQKISAKETDRLCQLFEKQYGVHVEYDKILSTALLFREGGQADARTLRAQTEQFFKNEIFKVCRLWDSSSFPAAFETLKNIDFEVETNQLDRDTYPLFFCNDKPEILLWGSSYYAERCRRMLKGYTIYDAQNTEAALKIAGEKDIRLVLLDVTEKNQQDIASEILDGGLLAHLHRPSTETVYEGEENPGFRTVGAFDYAPMAAGLMHDANQFFGALRERLPELPVYLLETGSFSIDAELEMSFVRAGARGKLSASENDSLVFEDMLRGICQELYMQKSAESLSAGHKVLYFETAPKLSADGSRLTVRLRDFSLKRAIAADDAGEIMDEVEKPDIRFSDVIGASDAKEELQFFIDYLKNPKKFSAQGLKPPKGVLLYGPPGTGKTMLAKAMAGESDVAFIPAAASSFVTKYQGSGPEAVRALFKRARRYAPAIIFIDEIDAIGRKRDGGSANGHGEEMALNALLTEMDGFSVDPKRPVFVLAATNFDVKEGSGGIGVIDPALARRFDRKILVDLPNEKEREQFLRMHLGKNKKHCVSDEMVLRLAGRSTGMSPANLASVMELANRMAVKAGKLLDDAILDEAFELTCHGEKKDWGRDYLERVARHESGHAFLCYLGGHTPSYLTIVARGDHGGYMEHSSAEMGPLSTKEELIGRIRTALGGRAAEIVYYGKKDGISTGASGDLEQATRIAQAMICNYGMDDDFGLAVLGREGASDPSVRRRVNEILRQEMTETIRIIDENRVRIDRMVDALLKKNKLTAQEMEELLK